MSTERPAAKNEPLVSQQDLPATADITPDSINSSSAPSSEEAAGVESPPRKDKPRKSRAKKKNAAHGGMGHNSRGAEEVEADDENVASRHFEAQITKARDAVRNFIEATIAGNKIVLPASHMAIVALYRLIYEIYLTGANEAFRAAYQIVSHGNSENEVQPLVAFLFRAINYDKKYLKYTVSRFAQVIAFLLSIQALPDDAKFWLETHGIEEGIRQYRAQKAELARSNTRRAAENEALTRQVIESDDAAPVCDATKLTARLGTAGFRLFAGELDLTGKYQLRYVFDHRHNQVIDMIAKDARSKQESFE